MYMYLGIIFEEIKNILCVHVNLVHKQVIHVKKILVGVIKEKLSLFLKEILLNALSLTKERLMSSIISFGNQATLSDPDSISDAKQCAHLLHK